MMIAIPLGYFVSVLLIIAGLMGGVEFLGNRPADVSRAELLVRLCAASWPLIAGTVVLLLIQIAKQVESLRIVAQYVPEAQPEAKKKKKVVKRQEEEEPAAPVYQEPAPAPAPAPAPMPVPSAPQNPAPMAVPGIPVQPPVMPVAPAATPVPPSTTRTPLYPNSPIPGGGRVPQAPEPMPAQADGIANLPTGGKRAPRKGEAQGLSFFKVD